jgi:hypothetical protein
MRGCRQRMQVKLGDCECQWTKCSSSFRYILGTRAKPHPYWYQLLRRKRTNEESLQSHPTTLKYWCVANLTCANDNSSQGKIGKQVQGFQPSDNLMLMGPGSLISLQCHHTCHTTKQKHPKHRLITCASLQKVWTTTYLLHKDENELIRLACGHAEVAVAAACNRGPCRPRFVDGSTQK